VDFNAIKIRQQATWASGDFSVIGTTLQIVGESLCEAADVSAGERVLDVACGNGNATLAAARRFAHATGVDYVPSLLANAAARARADGLVVELREGDAEELPFADASFDAVVSTFGVMFAPNQIAAAAELQRVCRPGGRIALASWTPSGFIGEMLALVGRFVPPPAGLLSPALWGKREHVAALFGDGVSRLSVSLREFVFRYESPEHFIRVFRTYYGPTYKAFGALDESGQARLSAALSELIGRYALERASGLSVPGEYLEVVATRR
jgi:ubiquinone/menaquinone biosynthesis C-methylase UbiE